MLFAHLRGVVRIPLAAAPLRRGRLRTGELNSLEPAKFARRLGGPPSPLRDCAAAAVAWIMCEGWFTEPKLGQRSGERRLVDQTSASWNQLDHWLRLLDGLRVLA